MPERIQRKRVKGWTMPEGAVYVGRPTRWGNPWTVGKQLILTGKRKGEYTNAADVVRLYRAALKNNPEAVATIRTELAGKTLACWCPLVDKDGSRFPCHADVLLEIANG